MFYYQTGHFSNPTVDIIILENLFVLDLLFVSPRQRCISQLKIVLCVISHVFYPFNCANSLRVAILLSSLNIS